MPSPNQQSIQGYSYEERQHTLAAIMSAVTDNGGWVLNRRNLSPATLELQIEVELRAIQDLYAALIAAGMELTRSGHIAFTELCTCRRHRHRADLAQIVELRLELSFLEEMTLQSILMSGSASA